MVSSNRRERAGARSQERRGTDSKTGKYIEMIRENRRLPDDILKRIPKLVDSLAGDKDVNALYSFGSLAQNALKPLSDLDFGILLSYQMNKKELF
jgi:UTP:GlnB (protein PII) uridylyltransferase